MLPLLLEIGFIRIYTFGVFLVLAFFWASFFLWKSIALTSFKEEEVFDGLFLSVLGGAVGGRVLYVIFHFSDFGLDFLKFILVNGYPGMHVLGFVFGFFLTLYVYSVRSKMSWSKIVDYFVAPMLLGLAIGKMGSFFSGSELGAQTSFFLALKYPNIDGARHLTSLYEALIYAIASYGAYQLLFRIRQEKLSEGFAMTFLLWVVGFVTVLLDPLKTSRVFYFGYSIDMIMGAVLLLTESIYVLYHFRASIVSSVKKFGRKKIGSSS